MKIMNIHWPIVMVVTVALYALILLSLPFDTVKATIFLFALVAYWSRLPGMGTEVGGTILFATDIVDMLACLIALNLGGVHGANFQATINLISRFAGVFPRWETVIKDIVAQYICCLVIPFIYPATGYDFTKTLIIYSIIRWMLFIPMRFIEPTPRPWPVFLWRVSVVQGSTIFVNMFYAKYFGGFFNSIIAHGVEFNWMLFTVATVIIMIGKSILMKDSAIKILNYRYWFKILMRKVSGYKNKERVGALSSDEEMILRIKEVI